MMTPEELAIHNARSEAHKGLCNRALGDADDTWCPAVATHTIIIAGGGGEVEVCEPHADQAVREHDTYFSKNAINLETHNDG